MPSPTSKLFAAAAIAAFSYGTWSLVVGSDDDAVEAESAELMVNHIWVEGMPDGERDMVRYFVPVRHAEGRIGVAGRASQWRQMFDLFLWSLEGDRLQMYFGQDRTQWRIRAEARRCDDDEQFDLCLTLWDAHHTLTLYSRDEWEIDPDAAEVPESLADAAPRVADAIEDALDDAPALAGHADESGTAAAPSWAD